MAPKIVKVVQPYQPEEIAPLVEIHNRAYPVNKVGQVFLSHHLNNVIKYAGQVWTIKDNNELIGYGYVTPVPGLTAVLDLQGCIDPDKQRQGFGRVLLKHIINDLKQNGRFQLSHAVPSLAYPSARFLTSQQFIVEHTEQQLILKNPNNMPTVSLPAGYTLTTYDVKTAVQQFRTTYNAIFQELPWYQPYTNDEEVTAELANTADLLFLQHNQTIAGFAWLRMPELHLGEIEPFGLLPAYQGQGLGRQFLTVAISELVKRGAELVRIGGWQTNKRALHLYEQTGFQPISTQIYLAYTYLKTSSAAH